MNTACGLDCYDGCEIFVDEDGTISGDNGLCRFVNRDMEQTPRITKPSIDGVEVSIKEAMSRVAELLKSDKSLLWRGSGNIGVMQEITNLIIPQIDGTITKGSLCDGAGEAGIIEARGVNKTLPLSQIAKADTIVVWGRNLTVTNAHILPYIKGKKIVVIDPIKTDIAQMADYHLQIQPRSDYFVAIMLARFIFMEDGQDSKWLKEFAPDYEDFYDFTNEFRIKPVLDYIGTDLGEMGKVLEYMRNQKVVFLVGTGVQKYSNGASVLHAIDSLASIMGLFGKEGCGVSYLGDSKLGFDNPFAIKCDSVSKVDTPFEGFDTVLVQGGNPCESMPNSNRVQQSLDSVSNLIYFGLYENETSKRASIIIPALNFFEKNDVRLNYGHHNIYKMNKVRNNAMGISEYEFTKQIFDKLKWTGLKSEAEYIDIWLDQCIINDDNDKYMSPAYQEIPYANGFGIDGGDEFVFVEDYDDDFINSKKFTKYRKVSKNKKEDDTYWLLSPKSPKSLNTQFKREDRVELHPDLGYDEKQIITIKSDYGEYQFEIKLNPNIPTNSISITSNTKGINTLTPPTISQEGNSASFQEIKVILSLD